MPKEWCTAKRQKRSNGMLLLAPADQLKGMTVMIRVTMTEMRRRTANRENLPVTRPIS
jgi:hypothetical protein